MTSAGGGEPFVPPAPPARALAGPVGVVPDAVQPATVPPATVPPATVPPATASPFAGVPLSPRAIVPAAFELLARAERDLRGASFYVGFLVLLTAGPVAALLWGLEVRYGDDLELALQGPVSLPVSFQGVVAALGFVVASVESRTVATAVLGARLEGRPVTTAGAVKLARLRFWRAIALGFLVGLLTGLVNVVVGLVVTEAQIAFIVTLALGILVEAPFVYGIAGIVLGEVAVGEGLRRSVRLFRARTSLAVVVSIFGIASQFILLLALGAGLDLVLRVVDAVGLDARSGVSAFAGTLVIGALLFAFGTLLFTAAAIAAAPQVVAFTGLTHYASGLEPARVPVARRWPWDPFVTRGLAIGLVVALVALVAGLRLLSAS